MGAGGSLHAKRQEDEFPTKEDGVVPAGAVITKKGRLPPHAAESGATAGGHQPPHPHHRHAAAGGAEDSALPGYATSAGRADGATAAALNSTPVGQMTEGQILSCRDVSALQQALLRMQAEFSSTIREASSLRAEAERLRGALHESTRSNSSPLPLASPGVLDPTALNASAFLRRGGSCVVNHGSSPPKKADGAGEGAAQLAASAVSTPPKGGKQPPSPSRRLMLHAAGGDVEAMQRGIESGVDVDAADAEGRTALHHACVGGSLEAARLLVQCGAGVNVRDAWGETPLRAALLHVNNDVANYLKECNACAADAAQGSGKAEQALNSRENESFCKLVGKMCGIPPPEGEDAPAYASVIPFCFLLYCEYGVDVTIHDGILREVLRLSETAKANNCKVYLASQAKDPSAMCGRVLTDSDKAIIRKVRMRIGDSVFYSKVLPLASLKEGRLRTSERTVHRLSTGNAVIGKWSVFERMLTELCEEVMALPNSGANATYIPELAAVDSELFSVSVCTVDGQQFHFGTDAAFTLQSCTKPLLYGTTIDLVGDDTLHSLVGLEQSGKNFNDLTVTINATTRKPYNALTNAGAMVTSSMYYPELSLDARFDRYMSKVRDMAGGQHVTLNADVYASEKRHAYRNHAIANMLMAEGCFPRHVQKHSDIAQMMDFYLKSCSVSMTSASCATLAATLANFGTCPMTDTKCMTWEAVRSVLQLCGHCGQNNSSGDWACTVGTPSKSGISGASFLVVPGVLGLCVYSPRLDQFGNSARGTIFAKKFAEKFNWSLLDLAYRAHD